MLNPVPLCTHIKTNGEVCGSPAVSGSEFCYHHSAVKTALGKVQRSAPDGGFAPIAFVFPEDRAAMQINFFLLLQAFNEQRIDLGTYRSMLSLMKAMARNLGRSGKLTEEKEQEKETESCVQREAGEREEDSNDIPPGSGDEVRKRSGRESQGKEIAGEQRGHDRSNGGRSNGSFSES